MVTVLSYWSDVHPTYHTLDDTTCNISAMCYGVFVLGSRFLTHTHCVYVRHLRRALNIELRSEHSPPSPPHIACPSTYYRQTFWCDARAQYYSSHTRPAVARLPTAHDVCCTRSLVDIRVYVYGCFIPRHHDDDDEMCAQSTANTGIVDVYIAPFIVATAQQCV